MTIDPQILMAFLAGIILGGIAGYNIGIPKGIKVCKDVIAEINGPSMDE
ncbi:MAG: hypothetical protein PHD36_03580 [Desulfotomaculaceae bacterium]|nr:hypothetical protein [Desulfotomaculaceae bacterium]